MDHRTAFAAGSGVELLEQIVVVLAREARSECAFLSFAELTVTPRTDSRVGSGAVIRVSTFGRSLGSSGRKLRDIQRDVRYGHLVDVICREQNVCFAM